MGEWKKQQESGSGEQGVSLKRSKPKYHYSPDYVHEVFHAQEENGECQVRCPFGFLDEDAMKYLGMYQIKMLSQDERGTVYKVTRK